MADIALTASQVSMAAPQRNCDVRPFLATVAITVGQAVFVDTSGGVSLADGNVSGTEQVAGIALNNAGIGKAVDVLVRGEIAGYTISGLAYGALVYLSDTAGALGTAAGTKSVVVGRVWPKSDADKTKVIFVNCNITTQF